MLTKITELIGSIRFWIITFGWLAELLTKVQSEGFSLTLIFSMIALWLGSVAAIGSLDSIASRIAGTK